MTLPESALCFDCEGDPLLGVLSPAAGPAALGVLIIVGGPQYRAGSHRQFVQLARHLAASGFPTLRFDVRGMGDSGGAQRSFEQLTPDIAAALAAFQRAQPALKRFVLWGLCDGASAALLYLHETADPRVAGLALLNPWVRSEASLAKTHVKHYYRQRLREREFWSKLLSGKVAMGAVSGLWRNLTLGFGAARTSESAPPFQLRMARAWATFEGPRLLLLSELDLTAREFAEFSTASEEWRQALEQRAPRRIMLGGADHTCSQAAAARAAEAATLQWLAETVAG
jgi:exosortase A-associated hydrolase 1